jgi:hypothetical protein
VSAALDRIERERDGRAYLVGTSSPSPTTRLPRCRGVHRIALQQNLAADAVEERVVRRFSVHGLEHSVEVLKL